MRSVPTGSLSGPVAGILTFILLIALNLPGSYASPGPSEYRVKEEYKLSRLPDGTVNLYTRSGVEEKQEYVFTNFNADVLLLIYRRIDTYDIIKSMTKKYHLSKAEARRWVKMTINELKQWNLIVSR